MRLPFAALMVITPLFTSPEMALALQPQLPNSYTSLPLPALKEGDSWVFEQTNENGANQFGQKRIAIKVQRVDSDVMVVGLKIDNAPGNYEDHIVGRDWSMRRIVDGKETVQGRPFSFPMSVGQTWKSHYVDPTVYGTQKYATMDSTYKVIGWEDVKVPGGTFHALKVEVQGTIDAKIEKPALASSSIASSSSGATGLSHVQRAQSGIDRHLTISTFYYVPEVKYFVKSVEEQYNAENVRVSRETRTMVSYKAAQ